MTVGYRTGLTHRVVAPQMSSWRRERRPGRRLVPGQRRLARRPAAGRLGGPRRELREQRLAVGELLRPERPTWTGSGLWRIQLRPPHDYGWRTTAHASSQTWARTVMATTCTLLVALSSSALDRRRSARTASSMLSTIMLAEFTVGSGSTANWIQFTATGGKLQLQLRRPRPGCLVLRQHPPPPYP